MKTERKAAETTRGLLIYNGNFLKFTILMHLYYNL